MKWQSLKRYISEILTPSDLEEKLALKRPLRIKYGVDVTAPFLHLGHAVNLWLMREFQNHGHKVVFLIGDFTTRIGDPTGKSKTRKMIAEEEIEANAKQFIEQVGNVLLTEEKVFEVRRNSEWYHKMGVSEFFSLCAMVTHSRLIQRDMFQKRIQEGQEIFLHEMLYPLLQGYDSVMLESDLTIVGTDQLFNENMGRFYQEKFGQAPQVILCSRITPGIDGKEKQSKSLGNYIALEDTPRDKFGKVMSIPDSLISGYLQVYTTVPLEKIQEQVDKMQKGLLNPMEVKKWLAFEIVSRYHGKKIGEEEKQWFNSVFSKREDPQDIPEEKVGPNTKLIEFLAKHFSEFSKTSLRKLAEGGGIYIDQERIKKEQLEEIITKDLLIRVGKRKWVKVKCQQESI